VLAEKKRFVELRTTQLLTTIIAVVVLTTTALRIFAFRSPISHPAKFVTLGEGGIWNAIEGVLGRRGGAPFLSGWEGGDDICDRDGSHGGQEFPVKAYDVEGPF
jgi:hypothetical protein